MNTQLSAIGISDSARPKTNVRLTISANNLADLDVLSKSDPLCIIFEKIRGPKHGTNKTVDICTYKDSDWIERGRTEMVKNSLNPQFSKTILIPYYFEEQQLLRIELYDVDSYAVSDLSVHDFLGRFECHLADIVSYSTLKAHLGKEVELGRRWKNGDKKTKNGFITIRAEEDEKVEILKFEIRGQNLDKKDIFGKSDPYLNFRRKFDDGSSHLVHRTEVKPKTLDPVWEPVSINIQELCGKDPERNIDIECCDKDKWKKDDLIGKCSITLSQLIPNEEAGELSVPLINEKKRLKKGKKYTNSGVLKFLRAERVTEPTFLDFIGGGTQLDFAVAIDFTASNLPVTNPSSLHRLSSDRPNQYEIALRACLAICMHYNTSKRFEAFGFGAKVPPNNKVSQVFGLDLRNESSSVFGIQGVMSAYRHALQNVQLYGPTNFAPIIDRVAGRAANMMMDTARYQILLIITDGIISDMHATMKSIINASVLPLSIIIIGVGNEDFAAMRQLDSDDQLLSQDSRVAQRDIVQFVTLRDFLNDTAGCYISPDIVMANLAREVMYEVPAQLTGYMKMRGFRPRSTEDPWARDSPPPDYDPVLDSLGLSPPSYNYVSQPSAPPIAP